MEKCKTCDGGGKIFREGFYPCPDCNEESLERQNKQLQVENKQLKGLVEQLLWIAEKVEVFGSDATTIVLARKIAEVDNG